MQRRTAEDVGRVIADSEGEEDDNDMMEVEATEEELKEAEERDEGVDLGPKTTN